MSLPRPVRAVVFDMDGLLIDSEIVVREAYELAMAELGLTTPPDLYEQLIGLAQAPSRALLKAHFGEALDLAALDQAWKRNFHLLTTAGVALKTGVVELLDQLDALGLKRAVATSSGHPEVQRHLGHHNLLGRFDAILARGDYEHSKPYPDPFLAAAKALGVDPANCLALEDSHNGVRAAHAAGMMTIMVPDLLHPTEEMRALALDIVANLHAVRALLTPVAA